MRIAKRFELLASITFGFASAAMLMNPCEAVEVSYTSPSDRAAPDSSPAGTSPTVNSTALTVPSPDAFVLGARSFSIPFSVGETASRAVSVHLFVSAADASEPAKTGLGNWQWVGAKQSNGAAQQEFEFTADGDGEYWFATWTTEGQPVVEGNQAGALLAIRPPQSIKPQQKIFVDTAGPAIKLSGESDGEGNVRVRADIQDSTPVQKVILRYATDQMKQWRDLEPEPLVRQGYVEFLPAGDWAQLSVQLIATDQAGNQNHTSQLIRRPRVADAPGPRYADASLSPVGRTNRGYDIPQTRQPATNSLDHGFETPEPTLGSQPRKPPAYEPRTNETLANKTPASKPQRLTIEAMPPALTNQFAPTNHSELTSRSSNSAALPPPATLDQISKGLAAQSASPVSGASIGNQSGAESIATPPASPDPQWNSPTETQPKSFADAMRPIGEPSKVPMKTESQSVAASPGRASPNEEIAMDLARQDRQASMRPQLLSRVPMRFSNSERFSLDYVLESVGSQGIDAIELYGSVDEGENWKMWGNDPDRISPFDIETRDQGVFSYRIVVVGKNGLASPRPLPGDLPDMMVVVDKDEPIVRLSGARYGVGDHTGALVIEYQCEDANLPQRPVTLAFSPRIDGPWTTIAGGLRNDGQYIWPADPDLPRSFYLRIDAKDQAGNVGTYILDRPIDAQGLAPRARIQGFQTLRAG